MSPVRRRAVLQSGALAVGTLAAATLADSAMAANPHAPATIPGLRFWRPRAGHFTLPAQITVVVAPEHEALAATAHQLALDLGAATHRAAQVVVRRGHELKVGEIHLRRGPGHARLGAEGYRLDVGSAVLITAPTVVGVHHGGRSLLQMLIQGTAHRIPAGTALDHPGQAERGLVLDLGRTHRSEAWLAARIREMGYLKLNRLQLRLTGEDGLRVELRRTPDHARQHLTQPAVRRLIALGQRHHVSIVPEVETRSEAVLTELLTLFPGRDVHLGVAADHLAAHTALVRSFRKRPRVWTDVLPPRPDPDVDVTWRPGGAARAQVLAAGHRLVDTLALTDPELAPAYETSRPVRLPGAPSARGTMLRLGAADDLASAALAAALAPRLRILAQLTWDSPKPAASYAAFAALDRRLGNPPAGG